MLNIESRYTSIAIICALCLICAQSLRAQEVKTTKAATVATFQGTPITEEDLQKAAAQDLENLEMQRLQFNANYTRNRHQILEAKLASIIEGKILDAEATKRGITREALLAKELEGKVKEPEPQEINAFYETNKQRIGQPLAQVTTQIQQFLKRESSNKARNELVERLKKEYAVSVSFEPLRMSVDVAGSPSRGPAEAPVTLVEFSDFQCPYCAGYASTLNQVMTKYDKKARLVYRQFPLTQIHPNAQKAAEASLCAADQGRFWEMHDLMFQNQAQLKEEDLKAKAGKLQLNMETFNACMNSGRYAARIKQDMREAASLGVTGTPALFINGRFLGGTQTLEDIVKIIEEELRKASHGSSSAGIPSQDQGFAAH